MLLVPRSAQATTRLAQVAAWRGIEVVAEASGGLVHYCGGPLHADRIAARLGIGLLEPADSWLPSLPSSLTRREVRAMTMGDARSLRGPVFVKPPSSKSFTARVYDGDLPLEVPDDTAVLVSEVVEFAAEHRLFLLDGAVHTGSRYATWGRLDPGPLDPRVREFAEALPGLPSAVVVDVGVTGPPDDPRAWLAVVEANMAWFSQPYASDLDRVLDVVLRSAGPLGEVAEHDRRFLRPLIP
ncbi:DUF4343 domain-containing protein [Lentzea tibetensis]|uniref:DUF4343 domain-containing protein n=1 Tax=Lentzea tibetensis TaxID=2591470 RepID=A0A563ESW9_9PSEU|nr:DUF4343 domain-containing protein [Lentzea tibetensis]